MFYTDNMTKWLNITQNVSKGLKNAEEANGSKWLKNQNDSRWLKMTQDDINWQNPCKNDFEWLKMLKTV